MGEQNNNLQLFSFTGNRSVTLLQKENLQVAEFLKNKNLHIQIVDQFQNNVV